MKKYEVVNGFDTKDKRYEIGDLVEENNLPKKYKWLIDQGIIKEHDPNENKVRARNDKGHYIADDPKTEKNEAWEEE